MTMTGHLTSAQLGIHATMESPSYLHKKVLSSAQPRDGKQKRSPGVSSSLSKIDPSFKSKRYRDKLRTEIKSLENLLPVDRATVHRKLDSQTVFRLSIGYFRTKLFLQAAGLTSLQHDVTMAPGVPEQNATCEQPKTTVNNEQSVSMTTAPSNSNNWNDSESTMEFPLHVVQALDGYLLVVTSDGTILYVSDNILQHLGFNQVDLVMRCIYGIVHPDDHQELKVILEQTLSGRFPHPCGQRACCCAESATNSGATCRTLSFLCRMKCFNGTTTGYLKMQCAGHMRSFPHVIKSQRTSNHVLFAFCRPFLSMTTEPGGTTRSTGFWTKHDLDLKFKQMETKVLDALGYESTELEQTSFYALIHPEDLLVARNCHSALVQSEEIQTMYFRVQHKDHSWTWLHTRGKVVLKNSKKYSIIFTHCPVREEDSTYIQQEALLRQRHSIHELMFGRQGEPTHNTQSLGGMDTGGTLSYGMVKDDSSSSYLHDPHGQCPSSWHTAADRHSPVFPQHYLPHQPHQQPRHQSQGSKKLSDGGGHLGVADKDAHQVSWYGQNGYHGNYPALALWNVAGGGYSGHDPAPDDDWPQGNGYQPHDSNNLALNSLRKEYFMHFNGVGFSSRDCAQLAPQYPASTLFIQGHVTAYESEARSASSQDACAYNRLPAICQYPACSRPDCTSYGALAYKNIYPPCAANSNEALNMYDYVQSHCHAHSAVSPDCTLSHGQTIKQEDRDHLYPGHIAPSIDSTTSRYCETGHYNKQASYLDRFPDVASVPDVTPYAAYDVTGNNLTRQFNYM